MRQPAACGRKLPIELFGLNFMPESPLTTQRRLLVVSNIS